MFEVKNIAFAYAREEVLRDVSFTAAPGAPVAVVGANGAGKTTLLRVLAGLAAPLRGSLLADGVDALREPVQFRRLLGYLPESAPVEPELTVRRFLKYRARLKGEQFRRIRHRVAEAIEACELGAFADEPLFRLSPGVRRRAALAEAVLLRPRVVVLDDPLAGVDLAARAAIVRSLAALASYAAVVVAGHELDDFARLAPAFLLLADGVGETPGTVADVRRRLAGGAA